MSLVYLFYYQIIETAITDDAIIKAAQSNPQDKFTLMFKSILQQLFIERIDQNEDIFARFMEERNFNKALTEILFKEAYNKINKNE